MLVLSCRLAWQTCCISYIQKIYNTQPCMAGKWLIVTLPRERWLINQKFILLTFICILYYYCALCLFDTKFYFNNSYSLWVLFKLTNSWYTKTLYFMWYELHLVLCPLIWFLQLVANIYNFHILICFITTFLLWWYYNQSHYFSSEIFKRLVW